jgi:hypothetical protein
VRQRFVWIGVDHRFRKLGEAPHSVHKQTIHHDVMRVGVRSGDKLLFESDGEGVRIRPIRSRSAFSKYRSIGNPEIPSGKKKLASGCDE